MFHVSLLELYHASTILGRIRDPPPPIEINREHEHEMEDILNSRIYNHQLQYLIHCHGYNVSECTWEPIKNLSNAMEKVHEFHQQYPNKPKFVFLMDLVTRRGGDVMDTNIRHHLPMDGIHP
jgi:hypothetical protein